MQHSMSKQAFAISKDVGLCSYKSSCVEEVGAHTTRDNNAKLCSGSFTNRTEGIGGIVSFLEFTRWHRHA
jgi:hypothetical protein